MPQARDRGLPPTKSFGTTARMEPCGNRDEIVMLGGEIGMPP
jgi:hypothetical protein